ncbi:MAG TPA: hypothetical protein VFF39_18910 [Verrucomicrobiae bacterium]|nr:hypothetical protein [Verrucomicrobiae bacterium]
MNISLKLPTRYLTILGESLILSPAKSAYVIRGPFAGISHLRETSFSSFDIEEDRERRKWLARRLPNAISMPLEISRSGSEQPYDLPCIAPPSRQAFRLVVAAALSIVVSRWMRGIAPIRREPELTQHSLRDVCKVLGVDVGQMSRVIAGQSTFSVHVTNMILHQAGKRISLVPSDQLNKLSEFLAMSEPVNWSRSAHPQAWFSELDEAMQMHSRSTIPPDNPHNLDEDLADKQLSASSSWAAPITDLSRAHIWRLSTRRRNFSWDSLVAIAAALQLHLIVAPADAPKQWWLNPTAAPNLTNMFGNVGISGFSLTEPPVRDLPSESEKV